MSYHLGGKLILRDSLYGNRVDIPASADDRADIRRSLDLLEFMGDDEKRFYSGEFKLSKRDFEDKKLEDNIELEMDEKKIKKKDKSNDVEIDEKNEDDDEDFYDDELSDGNGKFFLKILLLIFGLVLVVVVAIYLLNYFNRI